MTTIVARRSNDGSRVQCGRLYPDGSVCGCELAQIEATSRGQASEPGSVWDAEAELLYERNLYKVLRMMPGSKQGEDGAWTLTRRARNLMKRGEPPRFR
jgi:hypothetical protein